MRVTIADIAEAAGLSKGAVSYALTDKPGVSDQTRERVKGIAKELGWSPNAAARSLATQRAGAIGLVLCRPPELLGTEAFYMAFIAGIEEVLATRDIALMIQLVDSHPKEVATYERWWSGRRVDGVVVVDLHVDDIRVAAIRELGIPAVLVCDTQSAGGLTHVWTDDYAAMADAVRYLVRLGHQRIAHVGGSPELAHSAGRAAAFQGALSEVGLESAGDMVTDFSGERGADATRTLLTRGESPTAIVYDNDVMAVAGLSVAAEMGVNVPEDLSLLAWDDSSLCAVTRPPISAVHRDVQELGRVAARSLVRLINEGATDDKEGPASTLRPRGTTSMLQERRY